MIAHLACLALVCADLLWRSERVRLMMLGTGANIGFRYALALTAFGDSAALLTPMRAGGEVGRAIGARAAGVSMPVVAGVLALEFSMAYVLAAFAGLWLTLSFGGEWLSAVRATGGSDANATIGRVAAFASAAVVLLLAIAIAMPNVGRRIWTVWTHLISAISGAFGAVRRIPPNILALTAGLTVLSLAARITILPLLSLSLPDAPPLGVLALASFVLLYAQIAIPTPSGGGAIEFAVLQGGLGMTAGAGELLASWRLYMTLLPMIGGIVIGALVYGPRVVRGALIPNRQHEAGAA